MDTNVIINNYLNDYSTYFQSIERKLFVDIVYRNISINKLKESYQKLYGINARQFNSIKAQIDGKIKAIKELKEIELQAKSIKLVRQNKDLTKYTKDKEKWLTKLTSAEKNSLYFVKIVKKYRYCKTKIHYIKRQIQNIIFKISKINEDSERNIVRICFGSKDLFKKQYELEENKYQNHKQWKIEWDKSRSNQFMCLGSKDETFGNQTCQYDDNNNLSIKVATRFEKTYGKYIEIKNVVFKYGQAQIDKCKISYNEYTKSYNKQKYYKAMTHRFHKNEFGWYLLTTIEVDETPKISSSRIGAIGIDFNVNFAQLGFVDRFGNPVDNIKLKYAMYGKTSNQIDALMGDLAKDICELALYYKVPVFIEDLTLEDVKKNIDEGKKYNRMINGFPYKKFRDFLEARAFKTGAQLSVVNPRYTSIIGQFKYMKKYGISSHGSASIIIARRGLNFKSENIPVGYREYLKENKVNIRMGTANYGVWMKLATLIKKKFSFNERITKLYANDIIN